MMIIRNSVGTNKGARMNEIMMAGVTNNEFYPTPSYMNDQITQEEQFYGAPG